MADLYSRKILKVVVAQISQAIGWHSIQSTPLELMTDVLSRHLEEMGKLMHRYAEQFGHTEPDLDDVGLAFRDMGIYMHELEEYIRNVDCVACSFEIPKFPIPKDSHLNFLKPGSREVVTRPVHVHEHLPPMHPEMEEEDYTSKQTPLSVDVTPASGSSSPLSSPKATIFKRPGDPVSVENSALKRARLTVEEEGRPLREISSVMMTTSGFLSPAREGKLPESRTPLQPSDSRSNSPQPSSYPMVPPEVKGEKKYKKGPVKRTLDGVKKLDKENKKKEHKTKGTVQLDQGNPSDDSRVKKLVSMKELSKLKALKPGALKMMSQSSTPGPSTSAKPKATKSSAKSLQSNNQKAIRAANQAKATAAAVINAPAANMEVSATALSNSTTTTTTTTTTTSATITTAATTTTTTTTTTATTTTTTTTTVSTVAITASVSNTTTAITTTTADALNSTISPNTTTTAVPSMTATITDNTITTTTITTTPDAATSTTTITTTAPPSPPFSSTTIPANTAFTTTTVSAPPAVSSATTSGLASSSSTSTARTSTTTTTTTTSSSSSTTTTTTTSAATITTGMNTTTTSSSGIVTAATDTIALAPSSTTAAVAPTRAAVTTSSATATIIAAASSTTSVAAATSTALPPAVEKFKESNVIEGKLLAEPDKQKLNIFKKISKVKESEKVDRSEFADAPPLDSRESSPGLVIDESDANNRQREARMAQIEECIDSVIQRSMEIAETPNKPKTPGTHIVEDSSKIQYHPADSSQHVDSSNDVYMFDDDLFPPGTPSTPKTPELPISVNKGEKVSEPKEQKEKKKKKDKSKSKLKSKAKGAISPKKLKVDVADGSSADWPKTPEWVESSESASAPVFPFFPHFQPAPGLIPPPIAHPLFQRFPLPMAKNLPHPAMPNLPMPPPLFMQSRADDSADVKDKSLEKSTDKPPALTSSGAISSVKLEKEKEDEKVSLSATFTAAIAAVAATVTSSSTSTATTVLPERKLGEKKPKEHKKEKKEKERAKKKKERKEKLKNKEKEEKKKPKGEKKEKDKEKIKDKKEKKEKKKDKEREEKVEGIVPKLTFKLAPVSPRPPTPDATLRKIVIKPVLKKQLSGPDDDKEKGIILSSAEVPLKRDPSPELARISALITRPPRQKASSKTSFLKQESPADGFPTSSQPSLPPCASVVCAPIASTAPISSPSSPLSTAGSAPSPAASIGAGGGLSATKVKKAFKPISKLKARDVAKKSGADSEPHKEPIAFYYDNEGKKVWFCPACGGQDDGSPMIGCDDCDAWYHWVCVGIQVPPDENEDWYCCVCIKKKQEHIVDKKKKSRKRKMVT